MNVIDLFNTPYERALSEGAVDDLEARYIHGLNTKMLDLMARAKNADPEHKVALKQAYEKIKSERDSFYKIREAQTGQDVVDRSAKMKALTPTKPGVGGAVKDVAQGLKNFLQGKPETGPTYEAQKKNLNLSKGVIPTEPLPEHGGGIGPSQRWQDLMPEEKTRLDPKCWTGKKIGNPKTKIKGGVRVNNCVPAESINEVKDTEAVEQAILKRIMVAHRDMLMKYGPEKIMTAASDVAYNVGDIGEMGSSDISGWVQQVEQILGAVQEAKDKPSLRDPADNPCWKGYKPVGTKQKGGRTVPNCVPKD